MCLCVVIAPADIAVEGMVLFAVAVAVGGGMGQSDAASLGCPPPGVAA